MTRVCTMSDTFPSSPTYQAKINNICSGLDDETARLNVSTRKKKKTFVKEERKCRNNTRDKVKARCGTNANVF